MPVVVFFFDVISPFAWLAWRELRPLCERYQVPLEPRPVLFAALLNHYGQLGPAEIEPKRRATMETIWRRCHRLGISVKGPARHPFNPVTALRLCLSRVAGDAQEDVVDAIFNAGWQDGLDISDPKILAEVLDGIGLQGTELLEQTKTEDTKADLRAETEAAISAGCFGVPTMIHNGSLFWGHDSLIDLDAHLAGHDPVDDRVIDDVLARPGLPRPKPVSR